MSGFVVYFVPAFNFVSLLLFFTDEHSAELQYVDLLKNPERYTGYKGASPHRIWRSVYEENCFK